MVIFGPAFVREEKYNEFYRGDPIPRDFSYPMTEFSKSALLFSYLRAERTAVIFGPASIRQEKIAATVKCSRLR